MMITKSKLRRWAHLAGFLIAGVACAWVWLTEHEGLPLSAKFIATGVLLTTLLTKWDEVIAPRVVRYVDSTDLPETETTTTSTTTTTVTTNSPAADSEVIIQNLRKPGMP